MPPERQTDAELISASSDDPALFAEIFVRHGKAVFSYVARRVDREIAADIAAEVFARALKSRHTYDTARQDCRPWLYGIARNLIAETLRAEVRQQQIATTAGDRPLVHEDSTVERAMATLASPRLQAALDLLSPDDRRTFLLYAVHGYSYAEVARELSIPVGTVASRISRARAVIRDAMPDLEAVTGRDSGKPGETS